MENQFSDVMAATRKGQSSRREVNVFGLLIRDERVVPKAVCWLSLCYSGGDVWDFCYSGSFVTASSSCFIPQSWKILLACLYCTNHLGVYQPLSKMLFEIPLSLSSNGRRCLQSLLNIEWLQSIYFQADNFLIRS